MTPMVAIKDIKKREINKSLIFKIKLKKHINIRYLNLILNNKLNVYGLWFEIKSGNLMLFDDKRKIFVNINYFRFFNKLTFI